MFQSRVNFESFSSSKRNFLALHFERQFALKNVEKLEGKDVLVPDFAGPGRHSLLNHTQRRLFHQVPAIAGSAPDIVLGGFTADGLWRGFQKSSSQILILIGVDPSLILVSDSDPATRHLVTKIRK
jgi:hypothetical protein